MRTDRKRIRVVKKIASRLRRQEVDGLTHSLGMGALTHDNMAAMFLRYSSIIHELAVKHLGDLDRSEEVELFAHALLTAAGPVAVMFPPWPVIVAMTLEGLSEEPRWRPGIVGERARWFDGDRYSDDVVTLEGERDLKPLPPAWYENGKAIRGSQSPPDPPEHFLKDT